MKCDTYFTMECKIDGETINGRSSYDLLELKMKPQGEKRKAG